MKMKLKLSVLCLAFVLAPRAQAEKPLSIGLGLGGNSFVYSFNVDYDLTPAFRVGAGFGTIGQADFIFFEFRNFLMIPVHADYTFHRNGRSSFYLSAGVTSLSGKISGGAFFDALFQQDVGGLGTDFKGLFIPAGIGWEWRGNSGFTARISTYGGYFTATSDGERESEFIPPFFFGMYLGWAF
jgi:hypothetical protein